MKNFVVRITQIAPAGANEGPQYVKGLRAESLHSGNTVFKVSRAYFPAMGKEEVTEKLSSLMPNFQVKPLENGEEFPVVYYHKGNMIQKTAIFHEDGTKIKGV